MTDRDSKLSDALLIAFLRSRSSGANTVDETEDADLGEAASTWDALGAVAEDPRIREMRAAARARLAANDETVREIRNPDTDDGEYDVSPLMKTRARNVRWFSIAACFALLIAAGFQLRANRSPLPVWQVAIVLANGQHAPRTFRLADGSQVTLDAASQVDVAAWNDERRLTLRKGRAFFDVAHDRVHPFVVNFGPRSVTALGTRFAVSERDGDPLVMLERGRVRVTTDKGSQTRELTPGQQLILTKDDRWVVEATNADRASQWSNGQITFDAEPVSHVLAKLNPYLQIPLAPAGRSDGTARISGTFQLGDAQALKTALSALGIQVEPVAGD
jgi:transmembrane sensor